jgi:hypothetical protein
MKRLMPHGLIGGSDSFQIKSVMIRRLLFWTIPLLLVGVIISAIIVAANAEACDYERVKEQSVQGCRITKDSFGNFQIANIVFISVACIALLVHLRNMWRLSGNLVRAGSIPTNEKNSLMIGGMTLLVSVLGAVNLTIGFGFLYKDTEAEQLNVECMANTGMKPSALLAWALFIVSLVLVFIAALGVGGYAGVSSDSVTVQTA